MNYFRTINFRLLCLLKPINYTCFKENKVFDFENYIQKIQIRNRKWIPFSEQNKASQNSKEKLKLLKKKEKNELASRFTNSSKPKNLNLEVSPYQAVKLLKAYNLDKEPIQETEKSIIFNLGLKIDLSRDSIRGTCELPHSIGHKIKLLAFCPDEYSNELLEAGADFAGISKPLEKILAGKIDFDRCIATPEIMPQIMKVARILGPLKLMPNPKSGTIVSNLKDSIISTKSGNMLEYRAQGEGTIEVTIARITLSETEILENIRFFISEILKHRPKVLNNDNNQNNTGFIWPPLRSNNNNFKKNNEIKLGQSNNNVLINSSYIKLKNSPHIYIQPNLLQPQSLGYFR